MRVVAVARGNDLFDDAVRAGVATRERWGADELSFWALTRTLLSEARHARRREKR